jgi:protein SERAC1
MLNSIVFVHGLTGNRRNTWTHPDGVFWPEDLLTKDLPTARVMTFGYDADVVGFSKTAGNGTLRDHGKSLTNDLAMRRVRSNSTTRPLIFIAHSLGGLVVEQVRQIGISSVK